MVCLAGGGDVIRTMRTTRVIRLLRSCFAVTFAGLESAEQSF